MILTSCNTDINVKQTIYYPSKRSFEKKDNLVKINLDSTNLNYQEILQLIPASDYYKKAPYFEIINKRKIRKIIPILHEGYRKRRDIITITQDSVFTDKHYPISKIKWVFKNIFRKDQTSKFHFKNSNMLRIALEMNETHTGKDITNTLLKVTEAFDELDRKNSDSLNKIIYFVLKTPLPPFPRKN